MAQDNDTVHPPVSRDPRYDIPQSYDNLDKDNLLAPVQLPDETLVAQAPALEGRSHHYQSESNRAQRQSLAQSLSRTSKSSFQRPQITRRASDGGTEYDIPDNYVHLAELATSSAVENPDGRPVYLHKSLEEGNDREQAYKREQERGQRALTSRGKKPRDKGVDASLHHAKRFVTQLYTLSYLIIFSIFGTLARLGLQALTFYPGAPVVFSILWPNFAGSLFMGFLSEDRMLFKEEWGTPNYHLQIEQAKAKDEEIGSGSASTIDLQAAKKAHVATKKTIPLFIGLATGFCGSLTSFSTFIRDAFLAMSNDLPSPLDHQADYTLGSSTASTVSRNGGQSFMALLAVIIVSVAVSIAALHLGAHLAIALEPLTPSLPFAFCRKFLDRLTVFLAWGCWLGAIFLAIFPPDRDSTGSEAWRGRAVFAIIFAPLGCLGRFYASMYLNGKIASFPLGTFVVNIVGTAILGMCYDLQHVPLGGIIGCQLLQGVEDGFCGCLTTVSTWVSELNSLKRTHSYRYGGASIIVALCLIIMIMGSMQWTIGFSALQCLH
jgi:CrcB protein